MASAGIDFTQLTAPNGAVRELSQLIWGHVYEPENLDNVVNLIPGAINGEKLGLIGEFGLLPVAATTCNPSYTNSTLGTSEKTWAMANWEIALSICYEDLKATFLKYHVNPKTSVDDLRDVYINKIIVPRLEIAVRKAVNGMAWLGSTSLTGSSSLKLVNGIWTQLFTIASADATRKVAITTNTKAALWTSGVATGYIDSIITSAKPKLRSADNQVIYMTLAMADALEHDLKATYGGCDLQWQSMFNGIKWGMYNGIKVVALPIWDEYIGGTLSTESAPIKNLYRAVYTTTDNILVGVSGDNEFAEFDIMFDHSSRANKIFIKDRIGALVAEDDMVQMAF